MGGDVALEEKDMATTQAEYLEKMVKHLPALRAVIRITQRELASKIGITRQSMMAIETGKRPLQWSNYLALVLVFYHYEDTKKMMESFELFDANILQQNNLI